MPILREAFAEFFGSFDGSRFSFHIRIVFVLLYETALYDRHLGSQFYRDQ
ncbi:hypothetical protein [Leptospira interrogans]|nr:hypothetical protein [Leptospira interrogans]